jgi:hypothetical protein
MKSPGLLQAIRHLLKQMQDLAGHLEEYPAVDQISIIRDVGDGDGDCGVYVYLKDDEVSGGLPLTACVSPDEADIEAIEIALFASACLHKSLWPLTQRVRALTSGNDLRTEGEAR